MITGTYHRYHRPVDYAVVDDTPEKVRTLWPLPGGSGSYLAAVSTMLDIVRSTTDTDEVVDRLMAHFQGVRSRKAARSYLHVLGHLGLVELDGPVVRLSRSGATFLQSRDPAIVRDALLARIAGVDDLVFILWRHPARIGLLLPQLQARGYRWTTLSQVRYRLRWLEELGVVTRHGRGRPEYRVTNHP